MTKLPAFQFYPADWRKDPGVQSLSFHDRGVWFEILCLMHESEQRGRLLLNGKPMPDEALARLLGLDKQILTKTVSTLIQYGVASRDEQGALVNRRMVRDENLRIIRQNAGKMGGNPLLVKQNSTKIKNEVKQKSTPSSSSSSSSSDSAAAAKRDFNKNSSAAAVAVEGESEGEIAANGDGDVTPAVIAELQAKPAYKNLNVQNVADKLAVRCEIERVKPTRRRLILWLNREFPKNGNGNGKSVEDVDEFIRNYKP